MRALRGSIVAAALVAAACGDNRSSPADAAEAVPAQCADRQDNDGDGRIDFPNDPGCAAPGDEDERDDCPDGAGCPECANGLDDDANGARDYPGDPGCDSAADPSELADDPSACGAGLRIEPLPVSGVLQGTLEITSASALPTACSGGTGAPGIAYLFVLTEPTVVVASTDDPSTTVDTTLSIRSKDCAAAGALLGCNDNITTSNRRSRLAVSLMPGTYYLIVEGYDVFGIGAYHLVVQQFTGEGKPCTAPADCGPGLVCRVPAGETARVCARPVCSDGRDDDGDGRIDYPVDPGCVAMDDATEDDECPGGATCPVCSDAIDNDGDGKTDYPLDPSCPSAAGTSEACAGEQDAIASLATGVTTGTLVGAHDDHDPSCGSNGGADLIYTLTVPAMATLRLSTEGSAVTDTILSLMRTACTEPGLACNDVGGPNPGPSVIALTGVPAGTYFVAVDAYNAAIAPDSFQLAVTGTVAAGASCEGALFASGAFTCAGGLVCDGAPGARTCRSDCSDGVDNNGDGTIDFPNDPGCSAANDNSEDDVCPGPSCPACHDGIDNDGDGDIDFPFDTSCDSASDTRETCVQTEPIAVVTAPLMLGSTAGQTNDAEPSCAGPTGSGPDVALQLDLPKLDSLTLDLLAAHDTVHALYDASCGPAGELVCRDPLALSTVNLPAGRYFLIVDGYFPTSAGDFMLTTHGVVSPTGSCEGALFASGALTCAAGTTCSGPPGARTCRAQCSDGIDNNGDGAIDFPADPGCASATDDSEATVCPGAQCPVCANAIDDDGDTAIDYPADFGCIAAGGTTEVFCGAEADFGGAIAAPATTGTLAGKSDNFAQSCQSMTGNDMTFALTLPVPVRTLVVDTVGSTIGDTVLSIKDANCGFELACDDDGAPGADARSMIKLGDVAPGSYAITVDGYFMGNNGPFVLNVAGTVAVGTACTSPLFASDVLRCPFGTRCIAGTCN